MILVGIDVAKDSTIALSAIQKVKYCSTLSLFRWRVLMTFIRRLKSISDDLSKVKVGLEATGHYSYNFWVIFLIKVALPSSSIHYISICIAKVSLAEILKHIRLTPILLL